MNKISYGQFATMLLASDVFALICYSNKISFQTLICFIIVIIFQFILSLISVRGKFQKNNFLLWVYLISAILWGTLLFERIWEISKAIYIPIPEIPFISNNLIISALIALVCLYASSPGIKAISRVSVITAGFGVLCLIVIIFGSFKTIRLENFFTDNQAEISSQIISALSIGGSICILPYLSAMLKDDKIKSAVFYFICKLILYIIIITLTIMVSGEIMNITEFPVIRSAELCQPFNSQRIDALFIIILVILAVMGIAVQTTVSSMIIETLFPKFRRFKSTAIIITMIILALILGKTNIYSLIYGIIFLIPAVLSIILKRESK